MSVGPRVAVAAGMLVLVAACQVPSASPDAPDAASSAGAAADVHVCSRTEDCGPVAYCAFAPGLCGTGKRPGACRAKPSSCDAPYAPVCGCDGHTYPTECDARLAGVDLTVNGGCHDARPRDWIACGSRFCNARASYCEIVLSDVAELPTDYTCKPLPAACIPGEGGARACDCFPIGTRCRSFCGYLESGGLEGFHLTCRL